MFPSKPNCHPDLGNEFKDYQVIIVAQLAFTTYYYIDTALVHHGDGNVGREKETERKENVKCGMDTMMLKEFDAD